MFMAMFFGIIFCDNNLSVRLSGAHKKNNLSVRLSGAHKTKKASYLLATGLSILLRLA